MTQVHVVCMCAYVFMLFVHKYVYLCMFVYMCGCVCKYGDVYICVYVCMYVCTYMYVCMWLFLVEEVEKCGND